MINDALCFQTIEKLAPQVKAGRISPVELTQAYLERIRQLDGRINCFVTVTETLAIEQAKKAEQEIKSRKYRGPLHGIPFAVKDLLNTRGIRTTWGSRLFSDRIPDSDAAVIEKLRDAGAILLGKLSMTELAGGPPQAAFNGPVHNPWKLDHWTTGSSTGPAACAAAGFAAFTIGSETTASILGPSSACGIAGFRPTYGRVSRYGSMPLSWTMDKLGPMARGVADCATVFSAIHGADPRDPTSSTAAFTFDPKAKMAGKRIGIIKREFEVLKQQGLWTPYADAITLLQEMGAIVVETDLPDFPYREVSRFIWQVEGGSVFEPYARTGQLQEQLINKSKWFGWKAAMLIPAADYMKVLRIRHAIVLATMKLFQRFDVLLCPMSPMGARQIDVLPTGAGVDGDNAGSSGLLTAGNIAGLPAVSVPCGFTAGDLPIGLSFVGGAFDDGKVLEIAHAYERATVFHERRPSFAE